MFKKKRVARIRTGLKYIARCMDVQWEVRKVVPRAEVYVHGGTYICVCTGVYMAVVCCRNYVLCFNFPVVCVHNTLKNATHEVE